MVQVVGHRAYRAKYPENTLLAFNKAYAAGIRILETDLQLTKDGVVVINHDHSTGRTWDRDLVIRDTLLEELKTLRNRKVSEERLPTLRDLLEWVMDHDECILMLDMKNTNDIILMSKVFDELLSVKDDLSYWQTKIIWGVWSLDWYVYGIKNKIVKGFKVIVITGDLQVAKRFIEYSEALEDKDYKLYGISLFFVSSWTLQFREELVPLILKNDIHVFLWTVNRREDYNYTVGLPIYGVIVDDPVEGREIVKELNGQVENRQVPNRFTAPGWLSSMEGFRFNGFILLYRVVHYITHFKLMHVNILGYTPLNIIFKLLDKIGF